MRLLLVDDHPLVRKGLISVLSLEKDIEIAGEAANIDEAMDMLEKQESDIALVDLRLGNECGLDIIRKGKSNGIKSKFIVLTSSADSGDFRRAEELGADGYVLKDALPEELIYAVRLVNKGRRYYDPGIMDEVIKSPQSSIADELTLREQDVLMALAQGMNNKDIARKLYITEYTVKKHVSQILSKLNLADRTQAALYAYTNGLVNVS